jgi:DNA-binding YbaB/EbfC family protein
MFNGGNMQQMMRQAQKLQEEMGRKQKLFDETEIEASAGGGMVKVTILGNKTLKSIKIDPKVVDSDDVETLEDLIVAAINEASTRADEKKTEIMGDFAKLGL